jgi:thiol-disulfide isomerase/thioredoxin
MKNKIVITALLVIGLLIAGFLFNRYRVAPSVNFPDLALTDLNNNPVNLKQFQGKNVFVNFFATWCGPCIREMPSLQSAQASLQPDNFVFICISDEPITRLQSFVHRTQKKLIILHSVENMHGHNIYTIPTSYLLNKEGKVVFKKIGDSDWAAEASIAELRKAVK